MAIPKRVTKPTSVATLTVPPIRSTANTPPASASGRLTMRSVAVRALPNSWNMSRKIAAIENSERTVIRRAASCPLSNWPPYST